MHWYELVVDGQTLSIKADKWRRDLDSDAVVFVERYRDAGRERERELLRLHMADPHRHIRRLSRGMAHLN